MVSLQKSEQIFNTLMNGRIINREIIDNDVLVANPLFNEIMDNLEVYKKQYEMSGFKFLHSGDYVYITEDEKNTLADLAALHQTTDSKVLRAFLALPKHYPKINSAIAQFV